MRKCTILDVEAGFVRAGKLWIDDRLTNLLMKVMAGVGELLLGGNLRAQALPLEHFLSAFRKPRPRAVWAGPVSTE
jgi:hypothetical protein